MFLSLHRGFGDTFADQFERAFAALNATLAELGLTVENLVKINVWLKAINDLPEMEKRFHGLDFVAPGDLDAIAAKTDFLGVNYYTRVVARAEEAPDNLSQTVFAV